MNPEQRDLEVRKKLEHAGDPRNSMHWEKARPDYVKDYSLTQEDIPGLIRLAREWVADTDWPEEEHLAFFAPVHAWRALAQLRAKEAIPVLLDMMGVMDDRGDDWHLEEFPHVFAWIGPEAVEALTAYLSNSSRGEYARICAAQSLKEIAVRHPQNRDAVVQILTSELRKYADNSNSVNAFLIDYLLDLNAKESADLIEGAYAADGVDEQVVGNWDTVRRELGVEGLGLVPESKAKRSIWPKFNLGKAFSMDQQKQADRRAHENLRKKRKQQRKSRKQGRRRK